MLCRQLERLEDECQQEVSELQVTTDGDKIFFAMICTNIFLQTEIEKLKRSVERQRKKRGAWDREVSDQVDQLTQENLQLAQEVRRRAQQEKELVSVRTDVNTELSERQTNVKEHCDKIEQLNENIIEVNSARQSLESEIETLQKSVQSLKTNVDHSSAKEKALERKLQLQDHSLLELEKDCEKLRTSNLQVTGMQCYKESADNNVVILKVLSRLEKVSVSFPHGSESSGCSNSAGPAATLLQEIESFVSIPIHQQGLSSLYFKPQTSLMTFKMNQMSLEKKTKPRMMLSVMFMK